MTPHQIRTIGHLLTYYETDLNYIRKFQDCKNGIITPSEYYKCAFGFYGFLVEFMVVRSFTKGSVENVLDETFNWLNGANPDDVDRFAQALSLTSLTRGHVTSSLASKILFLNNPWEILPMDRLARQTLRQTQNNYALYKTI